MNDEHKKDDTSDDKRTVPPTNEEIPAEPDDIVSETDGGRTGDRPVVAKLVSGLHDETRRAMRSLLDRNPVGTDALERTFEIAIRLLNRREVLERILKSEFMRNVRDMQSEITEAVGIASQADVHELRTQLDGVLKRLDKLQTTLDEIVVEVDSSAE